MKQHAIQIEKIGLNEEHEIPLPAGLSDLINDSGAWNHLAKEEMEVKGYERSVKKEGDRLFTILRKK